MNKDRNVIFDFWLRQELKEQSIFILLAQIFKRDFQQTPLKELKADFKQSWSICQEH